MIGTGAATSSEWRSHLLSIVYGASVVGAISERLDRILDRHGSRIGRPAWSERDVWLITYADQFQREGERPLVTLHDVWNRRLSSHLNGVHVLPFYPWTSDDGFSITDYEAVDPQYGSWGDIEVLAESARLMIDGVINHLSAESRWFREFLAGSEEYAGFFKTVPEGVDVSAVVRPRTHPLGTRFESSSGPIDVWTTFSPDQVDLDYANPEVLLRVIEVILGYAARGADAIRLDAIGFLWKDPATPSIHMPQTHAIVQLIRACLDVTYPAVILISETNVPHAENISYLGPGDAAEAQAVYQFSLPPLTMHAVLRKDASWLRSWAEHATDAAGDARTFFNFLGSHDGVGVRPVEGILPAEEVDYLVDSCMSVGGGVNRRRAADGTEVPYELNTTWFDAMTVGVDEHVARRRHLAAHSVMLAMPGIAAIYVHSLFGGSNDREGAARTGMNRTLNRRRFTDLDRLETALDTPGSREHDVWTGLQAAIDARRSHPAFHPSASMTVLDLPDSVFGIERTAADGAKARCVVNLGDDDVPLDLDGWVEPAGGPCPPVAHPLDAIWAYTGADR